MKKLQSLGNLGRFFGANETLCGQQALAGLSRLNVHRALLICSNSVFNTHSEYIKRCLSRFTLEIIILKSGEPTIANMKEALNITACFAPDVIVAIGGGSVIDSAKLIWAISEKPELNFALNKKMYHVSNLRSKISRFVAVPTTYGSGSENSSAAVFQFDASDQKRFLVGSELLPDVAVLDPALAVGLPTDVAINGVMDSLAHLIEGYVSLSSNSMLRRLSVASLINIKQDLDINSFARSINIQSIVENYMVTSSFAGIVQNIANPGLAHSLSHYCAKFGVSHGAACGYFLPFSIEYNSLNTLICEQYESLASDIGFKDRKYLSEWLVELCAEFNIGSRMPNTQQIIQDFDSECFLNDPTIDANPTEIKVNELLDMMSGFYEK